MKSLRRFSTSVVASFNWMMSQIENHEALVDAAIVEVQNSLSQARLQARRIQRELQSNSERKLEIEQSIELWKQRALQVKDQDQKKALECIKRLKLNEHELKLIASRISQYKKLDEQLKSDLKAIEQKLANLKLRKSELSSRQTCAQAMHTVDLNNPNLLSEIDQIFDRWEQRIMQFETDTLSGADHDELEKEFSSAEQQADLESRLNQLSNKQ